MRGLNKVTLIGNLGRDPEIRYTQSGIAVANLSIATSESWKGKDGQRQERTEWHRLVLWDQLATIAEQYLTKGRQIYIEGRLQTRKWTGKEGEEKFTTEIRCDQLIMLGGDAQPHAKPAQPEATHEHAPKEPFQATDPDVPF